MYFLTNCKVQSDAALSLNQRAADDSKAVKFFTISGMTKVTGIVLKIPSYFETTRILAKCFRNNRFISYKQIYTGCPRRNGQNFGRVFLMLSYTDITQNNYIQS